MSKVLRVYVDTSVIGGCFDDEFKRWSNALVDNFRMGYFKPVVSRLVSAELIKAPVAVQDKYAQMLSYGAQVLEVDVEVDKLLRAYRKRKIVSEKFDDDMLHIALATVANVDILVSWNFKHIVHYAKISQFNAVNIEEGYKTLAIYSPMEVAYEKEI